MNRYTFLIAGAMSLTLPSAAQADHAAVYGPGQSGPLATISPQTLDKGRWTAGFSSEFVKSRPFTDRELAQAASRHIHAHSIDYLFVSTLNIGYGVTDHLTLSVRIPYIYRQNIRAGSHSHSPGGVVTNTAVGHGDNGALGDASLLGQYRFWEDAPSGWQSSLLLGLKMPTGETDAAHDGGKLETEHQGGSGSWDPLMGLAAGKAFGPFSLDGNMLFVRSTEGSQRTDLGGRLSYNLALSYRLGGEEILHRHADGHMHSHGHAGSWDLVLELNGEWSSRQKIGSIEDEDSGGNQVLLSPGMRYTTADNWSAYLSVGVPVSSSHGAGHADTDYRVLSGISRSF